MKSKSRIFCFLLMMLYSVILHAQDSHWSVNIYDYQYDMTVYAKLQIDGVDMAATDYSNYEIAALVNNECRGVGTVQTSGGYTWVYLRIKSNTSSGEKITFKMFNKSEAKEKTLTVTDVTSFTANSSVGLPSSPIALNAKSFTIGDINGDDNIDSSDLMLLVNKLLGNDPASFVFDAADINQDGSLDSSDLMLLVNKLLNQ